MAYSLWYVNNKINEMTGNISACDSGKEQLNRIIASLNSIIDNLNGISSSVRTSLNVDDQAYKSQDFQAIINSLSNAKNNLNGVSSEISSKRSGYEDSRYYWKREKNKLTAAAGSD